MRSLWTRCCDWLVTLGLLSMLGLVGLVGWLLRRDLFEDEDDVGSWG